MLGSCRGERHRALATVLSGVRSSAMAASTVLGVRSPNSERSINCNWFNGAAPAVAVIATGRQVRTANYPAEM